MPNYSAWLTQKFREWEASTKRKQPISEFARYIGVNYASLSRWMSGDTPPNYVNTQKIARKLGNEIFDILGYDKPYFTGIEPRAEEWQRLWNMTPSQYHDDLIKMFKHWIKEKGLDYPSQPKDKT